MKTFAKTLHLIFPGICFVYLLNRLNETILTNIQNICSIRIKNKIRPFVHIFLLIKHSL